MTRLNIKLIQEANERLEKNLSDHLDFIEQSRVGFDDALALEKIIKTAQTRITRYLALQELNVRLNKVREAIANSADGSDSNNSRPGLMKVAVDAGLPLQKAAELYDLAVREGKAYYEEHSKKLPRVKEGDAPADAEP